MLLEIAQPIVREILDGIPVGVALDAACGTGRHRVYLSELGHEVIGVDTSPAMLERAREKVPGGTFHEADLHDVPLRDDSVDLVVCAIALSHVSDLEPALAEFVRVLRPKGHLRLARVDRRHRAASGQDRAGRCVRLHAGLRSTRERLPRSRLPLGLQVRRCVEPLRPSPLYGDDGTDLYDGVRPPAHVPGNPPNIWSLHALATAATNTAWRGQPAAIIWHFQLAGD
jgi:SAM-dependent methyltransferase